MALSASFFIVTNASGERLTVSSCRDVFGRALTQTQVALVKRSILNS